MVFWQEKEPITDKRCLREEEKKEEKGLQSDL